MWTIQSIRYCPSFRGTTSSICALYSIHCNYTWPQLANYQDQPINSGHPRTQSTECHSVLITESLRFQPVAGMRRDVRLTSF
ncbi:hypothetical protein BDW42DRAFT_117416 [Aspergillus taichungensis]|uniref:Uncharacterized protein n=1 Tax=Aspergillus taichungensis TaxID=482145 RepID=A0A2J5HRT1_9EURO|nr:hypothetical protein BDW42DRAFT_117416 [Aspergillus taichungensis]